MFLLFIFFEINHQGKPQIVYGKIISNGVISIKPDYATSNSNQPMILVVCDDKILVKVELDRETLAAGYKIEKNERVKVRRFQRGPSSSDTYEGKLIPL